MNIHHRYPMTVNDPAGKAVVHKWARNGTSRTHCGFQFNHRWGAPLALARGTTPCDVCWGADEYDGASRLIDIAVAPGTPPEVVEGALDYVTELIDLTANVTSRIGVTCYPNWSFDVAYVDEHAPVERIHWSPVGGVWTSA